MNYIKHFQELSIVLLADRFSQRKLEENKKTMDDLCDFQRLFGTTGGHFADVAHPTNGFLKDLVQANNKLSQAIFDQMQCLDLVNMSSTELTILHRHYEIYCNHREVNDTGKVWVAQSKVRMQLLEKAKVELDKEEKIRLLCFIINNSNNGNKEHEKAKKLLKEVDPAGCRY